ncbi:MAG: anti-sigma B factor RsbW [Armatimonadetes bacterium]|nr:anti-sigma B factor RsbW [Armatimonadota bacterium]
MSSDTLKEPQVVSVATTGQRAASAGLAGGRCREDTVIEIRIPSDLSFVRVVRLAVSGVASMMPFTYDEVEDIKLAVSEACNNAIQHAHDGTGANEVIVRVVPREDALTILVQDRGRGIPLERRRKATVPPEEVSEQGLGLFLIEALMDGVEYDTSSDSGTSLRMVKHTNEDINVELAVRTELDSTPNPGSRAGA